MTKLIHILHLSDIHLGTVEQGNIYYSQLQLDLTKNLELDKLNYLLISGDIANKSTNDEYKAAFKFINQIKINFGLKDKQVIMAPGNHDLNWDLSAEAYTNYIPKHKLPEKLTDSYMPMSDTGALLRDEDKYKNRFDNFSGFYKEITGNSYPTNYEDQAILHTFTEHKLLILSLNSAWQIDHHYTKRASINQLALGKAIKNITSNNYKDWLKIAIWHHPITGLEMMNADFLEQLAVSGFEICLHGHIHQAISGFYNYDNKRALHIIGSGTFGAPTKAQTPSIPLQYNLLILEPNKASITLKSRKKETVDGAWSADSRWGDKETPTTSYSIELKHSFQENKQTSNP
ncbi:MAG: metallophosphoesterase [Acidobacteria bacterium]|nr:metallophosphoesterase [Acidobacteriota bacterium]